ncbi:hypothetical protein [Kineococcus sp. SYSU DK002]|uniref:hypothetical protein n=1 Tax=Kineococcus sp. SYSU DK002 TaxID=3383123 RepID=UPI003D7CEC64
MTPPEGGGADGRGSGASVAGAVAGGLVLVGLVLPLLLQAVAWSVLDPGAAARSTLLAMAAVGVVPVPLAAGIARAQRAGVRVTALLVAVPQAVLSALLLLPVLVRSTGRS